MPLSRSPSALSATPRLIFDEDHPVPLTASVFAPPEAKVPLPFIEPFGGGRWSAVVHLGGDGERSEAAVALGSSAWVGVNVAQQPRPSAVRDDGGVYHTYSTYSRGLDGLWGMYHWFDRDEYGRH